MTGLAARVLARIRDIPACCICRGWTYDEAQRRWIRPAKSPGCPWHGAR